MDEEVLRSLETIEKLVYLRAMIEKSIIPIS
jgi:hypothetical protein